MTQFTNERPKAVSVIGWFCIVFGSFWLLASIWNVTHWLLEPPPKVTIQRSGLDMFWDFIFFCMWNIDSICCVLQIIAGIYLLKLRPWTRSTIEVISWLGIIFHGTLAVLFVLCTLPGRDADEFTAWVTQKIRPTAIFLTFRFTVLAVVNGFIIYILRSKKVRDALAKPPRIKP